MKMNYIDVFTFRTSAKNWMKTKQKQCGIVEKRETRLEQRKNFTFWNVPLRFTHTSDEGRDETPIPTRLDSTLERRVEIEWFHRWSLVCCAICIFNCGMLSLNLTLSLKFELNASRIERRKAHQSQKKKSTFGVNRPRDISIFHPLYVKLYLFNRHWVCTEFDCTTNWSPYLSRIVETYVFFKPSRQWLAPRMHLESLPFADRIFPENWSNQIEP